MNIEEFRLHCLSKPGATESIPFSKLDNLLVFKVKGKIFTATDLNSFEAISIKHYSESIDQLKAKNTAAVDPAYFSKKHWCQILMDGTMKGEQIKELIDISYSLVVKGLSKKLQAELKNENKLAL